MSFAVPAQRGRDADVYVHVSGGAADATVTARCPIRRCRALCLPDSRDAQVCLTRLRRTARPMRAGGRVSCSCKRRHGRCILGHALYATLMPCPDELPRRAGCLGIVASHTTAHCPRPHVRPKQRHNATWVGASKRLLLRSKRIPVTPHDGNSEGSSATAHSNSHPGAFPIH